MKIPNPDKQTVYSKVNFAIYIMLAIMILSVGVVAFWLIYPYKTADIVEPIPILNTNHEIKPNEAIIMEVEITKYHLYPGVTANSILCNNGRIYTIAPIVPKGKTILPVGTYKRIQNSYSLPGDAEPGAICHFEFQNTYEVNPIRSIIKTWVSEDFKVI